MGCNNCFSEIIADVFPPWHCVKTHLNAPEQETARMSDFKKLLTLGNVKLIKYIWLLLNLFFPMEAVRVYLVFHSVPLCFDLFFAKQKNDTM